MTVITTKVTDAVHKQLKQISLDDSISISEYIRVLIMHDLECRGTIPVDDDETW